MEGSVSHSTLKVLLELHVDHMFPRVVPNVMVRDKSSWQNPIHNVMSGSVMCRVDMPLLTYPPTSTPCQVQLENLAFSTSARTGRSHVTALANDM